MPEWILCLALRAARRSANDRICRIAEVASLNAYASACISPAAASAVSSSSSQKLEARRTPTLRPRLCGGLAEAYVADPPVMGAAGSICGLRPARAGRYWYTVSRTFGNTFEARCRLRALGFYSGSIMPGGGVLFQGNLGGRDQSLTLLKSTVAPENSASSKTTRSPENLASEKSTVPPEKYPWPK